MASKRKRVSKHISVDEENKVVYLIDDGEDMAKMEDYALASYQKNGYEVRVPKPIKHDPIKSRGKAYFKKECTPEEWEKFQEIAKNHDGDTNAFASYRRAIDWFYGEHPEKKPPSRVKREQEQAEKEQAEKESKAKAKEKTA